MIDTRLPSMLPEVLSGSLRGHRLSGADQRPGVDTVHIRLGLSEIAELSSVKCQRLQWGRGLHCFMGLYSLLVYCMVLVLNATTGSTSPVGGWAARAVSWHRHHF